MTHQLCGRQLINGRWVGGPDGEGPGLEAVNPATGETLSTQFAEATAADVDAALTSAEEAFISLGNRDPRWPASFLEAIAVQIEALGDALLERAELETALPRARLVGERARTCGQLRMFAEYVKEGSWLEAVIDQGDPARQPQQKPDVRRMLRPRGPVAVFGASNFPYAFGACGGDTASSLAGGNPVIVKGHPSHPGTSELFASAVLIAMEQCQLPAGLFALLQGKRHELSAWLVEHPQLQAVGFTGSERAGRALFDLAARREVPIPVYAEMGSLNPVVILPGALRERSDAIARDLSASLLAGGGQFCTKPGVVFVVGEAAPQFVDALTHEVRAASKATMLNASLRDAFVERAASLADVTGVRTLVAGQASGYAVMSPALFEAPAALFRQEPSLRQEAFGPGGVVVRCESVDEALACVEVLGGNLTGTLHFGSDDDAAATSRLLQRFETSVGRVIANGYPTGVEVCHATIHGGPYPATTDSSTTSVGSAAIRRFVRPVAYQNMPQELLSPALRDDNPLGIRRLVNGKWTDAAL
jgi:NADP-dependent aldehyde dehydrogenase